FAAFSGHDLEKYPTIGELADAFRTQDPNLLFLDLMSDRNAALGVIPDLLRLKAGVPIVAVMSGNDPDLLLQCLRLGTAEFLMHPFTEEQVEASLQKLAKEQPASQGATNRSKVVLVMPAKGGSGATTIASNLAYRWKKQEP